MTLDLRVIHILANCVISDKLETVVAVVVVATLVPIMLVAGKATQDGECSTIEGFDLFLSRLALQYRRM
jgi:hypothetical protein